MNTSHPKFKRMMALFTQTGKQGYRHTYAWEASNGRTESTKELEEWEVDAVIGKSARLQTGYGGGIGRDAINRVSTAGDKQRKKMIAIAGKMGWGADSKAIVSALNAWCLKQKYEKPLMKHSVDELGVLLYVLEHKVYKSYLEGLAK
ncbi:MAG: hypothetical protein K2Q03_06015 [Sphingobacteriaceae bacterium]|nr:hypothetical protein [Sphingobacteriaceae bacterium]